MSWSKLNLIFTSVTSVLIAQCVTFNSASSWHVSELALNGGTRVWVGQLVAQGSEKPPIPIYVPPERGAPRSTRGTGSRGGIYLPPISDRGTPRSTQGTGSRGGIYLPPISDRGTPRSTQGTASRGGIYLPPISDRGAPQITQGAGSRSDENTAPLIVTLLIPNDHAGRTVASHPTFFWHLSEATPFKVEFALVESGIAEPIFVQQLEAKPGVMQLTLPETAPGLEIGKEYRWSVSLIRNAKRRSNDIYIQGWIKRVPMSDRLTLALDSGAAPLEQAQAYGQDGLWYDALAVLSQANVQESPNPAIAQQRLSLLQQVGISLDP